MSVEIKKKETKGKLINFRLSEIELEKFSKVCKRLKISKTEFLRQNIEYEYIMNFDKKAKAGGKIVEKLVTDVFTEIMKEKTKLKRESR